MHPELSESPWRPGEPLFFSGNWTTPKKAAAFWEWLMKTGITEGYTEFYPSLLPAPCSPLRAPGFNPPNRLASITPNQ